MRRRVVLVLLVAVVAGGAGAGIPIALRQPSNARNWRLEQTRLPEIQERGDSVWIGNVRAFRWRADSTFAAGWEDRVYDLRRLKRVYFVLSPFARAWRGPAHTFLTFEFDDGQYLAVSVEARKEVGEDYSPLRGLARHYELMYVLADERDLIGLRAVSWREPVYLYPARATPAQARVLLSVLLLRAHELETRPRFYNTLTSNCTTNLVDAVNTIAPHRIRASWQLVFPGYSDALALRLGLLDTALPLDGARARFRVDARARAAADAPDFSRRIREPDGAPPASAGHQAWSDSTAPAGAHGRARGSGS